MKNVPAKINKTIVHVPFTGNLNRTFPLSNKMD